MDSIKKYDIVFKDEGYRSIQAAQGLRYVAKLCNDLKFKSVLDVGCGPSWSVLEFLGRGYRAQGIESCEYLFSQELRVPFGLGIIKKGVVTAIPFSLNSFDLVFCTDVLEHISEQDIDKAISELVRVTKKYIYCTICFNEAVCFPELKLHSTVKPREWWLAKFSQFKIKLKEYGELNEFLYVKEE